MRSVDQQWVPTGIGKKVEPETVQKDPWIKTDRPGVYRNTETGQVETRIPGNEAANHQPHPWEELHRRLREQGLDWASFYPLGYEDGEI